MVSFTTLALLATSAIAGPIARQIAIPEKWNWHVEGWEAGCGRSGCSYNFNITVPTVEGEIAGVKASCRGSEQGYENRFTIPSTYEPCRLLEGTNNGVAAKFSLREHDGQGFGPKEIIVSFLYAGYEERPSYNFSGSHEAKYNMFVSPLLEFDMTATEVFGIA